MQVDTNSFTSKVSDNTVLQEDGRIEKMSPSVSELFLCFVFPGAVGESARQPCCSLGICVLPAVLVLCVVIIVGFYLCSGVWCAFCRVPVVCDANLFSIKLSRKRWFSHMTLLNIKIITNIKHTWICEQHFIANSFAVLSQRHAEPVSNVCISFTLETVFIKDSWITEEHTL